MNTETKLSAIVKDNDGNQYLIPYEMHVVFYDDLNYGVKMDKYAKYIISGDTVVERIGNVYDNPELLDEYGIGHLKEDFKNK